MVREELCLVYYVVLAREGTIRNSVKWNRLDAFLPAHLRNAVRGLLH